MGGASLRIAVVLAGLTAAMPGAVLAQSGDALAAKSYGPSFSVPTPRPDGNAAAGGGGVSEYDLSLGCIVGGTAGTALSISAGGMNVVNLIAGGLVPASSPVAMFVALSGVVFASFCSVGQALTPTVMASYSYFVPPDSAFADPTVEARYCQVAESLTPATPPPAGRLLPARYMPTAAERM